MVSTKVRHRITEVDDSTRTGVCSECGPVGVYSNTPYKGRPSWRCARRSLDDATARYHQDPEAYRNARFQRLYGITVEQYDEMLDAQGGTCARCDESQDSMRLAVDHDHETGEVRGLLCGPCNTYLGRLEARLGVLAGDLAYIGSPLAQVIVERLVDSPVKDW